MPTTQSSSHQARGSIDFIGVKPDICTESNEKRRGAWRPGGLGKRVYMPVAIWMKVSAFEYSSRSLSEYDFR